MTEQERLTSLARLSILLELYYEFKFGASRLKNPTAFEAYL
jgi:hypothetical protein